MTKKSTNQTILLMLSMPRHAKFCKNSIFETILVIMCKCYIIGPEANCNELVRCHHLAVF
jgi:hypothetical protein